MAKSNKAAHLTAQEQLFRILFENAAVGIAQLGRYGNYITVNNKVAEITGYTKEELLQKTFHEITYPDDLENDLKQAEAMYRGEIDSYSMEKRYIRKDGSIGWVNLTSSAVFNDNGDFEMAVGIIEDISEKKQTEEALHRNLQLYKVASSAAKIGAYFRNLQTGKNQWSPEFLALYGLKPDEALLMKDMIPQAVHPDDRESVHNLAHRHYDQSNNTEFSSDHRIILPDGTIRWLNVRGITERDLKKNPVKTYGIAMDITERKVAEDAIRKSEEKYRTLFNSIDEGFSICEMLVDKKGKPYDYRWLEVNPTWEKQTGLKEPVGRTALEMVPNLEKNWINIYGKVALTGEPVRFQQGSEAMGRWFDVYSFRVGAPHLRQFGILFNDITERKNFEKQLINDNKLFEDLLYIAAHDLKGPVANMDSSLDLMDSLPMERKVMFLDKFRDIASQLNNTIQGVTKILHMQNVDKSAASPINVEMLLDKILKEFNSQLDQISIKTNFEKPIITYIEIFLHSIIKNLISNSIKYCRENVPPSIEITTKLHDDFTVFSIRDNGIGIDIEKYREQLFTPFRRFSTKKISGTGIGLYLVKNIIEQNGGYIKVESTPGQGTTFYCYLKEY